MVNLQKQKWHYIRVKISMVAANVKIFILFHLKKEYE